ncbi:alpha/beta fold hydrolase [Amycolatopsis aidingensis]|uniref:alpha/beta fold hydrolase n=1 Tax=Amycolatopsis aidingensis TaxID=2842453 RepID=UPI001C0DDDF3|nr:alpha/beta fold hydrolase [Amycolatopsis aidingensis]
MTRRLRSRLLALALTMACVPVFVATGAPAAAKPRTGPHLEWGPCPDGAGAAGVECATLRVPVDWQRPRGPKLTLAIGRLKATGQAEGSVLVGFGGPVGSYIELLGGYARDSFTDLRTRMNVVTWDIRGGPGRPGLSRPVLDCQWRVERVPEYPRSPGEYARLAANNKAAAQRCRSKDPLLFDNMDSASNARDMEAIRRALGEPGLNYYGSSYGGLFGQAYARLFPDRVRTMVLDGSLSHSADSWWRELGRRAADNERSMRRFFDWCAEDTGCALHGHDLPRRWQALTARADREPIPAPKVDASYGGRDLRNLGLMAARQGPSRWGELAEAIMRAEQGDASGFAPQGRIPYPAVPVPAPVECLELPRAGNYWRLTALTGWLRRIAPNVGAASPLPMNTLHCEGWPTPVTNPPRPLPRGLPPLLGAGYWNEFDAVSRVIAQVPGSGSIRHEGPGHVLYFSNACARAHIDSYLTNQEVPPKNTEC